MKRLISNLSAFIFGASCCIAAIPAPAYAQEAATSPAQQHESARPVTAQEPAIVLDNSPRAAEQARVQVPAKSNGTLWEEANAAYYAGNFATAAALYDSIERSGAISAKLYYNKAGALFKMGKTGESILYYNKALKLAPADGDIAHNLAIANTYTRNRIEPVPEFFVRRWMRSFSSAMGANAWAGLSVALLAAALAGVLLYLLPLGRRTRKAGFYTALASLVLLVFAFSFAWSGYREGVHPTQGIVLNVSAAVKSSPDNSGKDLFVLYEGDKVTVHDALGGWSEITVANGSRGWIKSTAISMID